MTTTMPAKRRISTGLRVTRKRILALVLVIIGLLIVWQAQQTMTAEVVTILTFQPGNPGEVPSITIPTMMYLTVTGLFFLIAGVLGLWDAPQLSRLASGMMIVSGVMIIPTVLIGLAANNSTNITTIIAESLRLSTPIAIGAIAGLWSERAGVVNIAIEGMMLFGACFGFVALFYLRGIFPSDQIGLVFFIAVCVAVLTGGIVALLHGWLSITFSTDQIVSGTVINILALGVTSFIRREYLLSTDAGTGTIPSIRIPILADIPIFGEALFNNQPIFYMMFVVIFATSIIMYQTRFGLRIRSVGENPHAADTLGIRVNRTRWIAVFISGCIAGLAGAWFSLEATGRFNDGMTRGSGFIALAALIFGKWTAGGAFLGALLFGFSDSLGTRFQIIGVPIPVQFLQMVPYAVTLIVLAGLVGRAFPPKAIGVPYKKE